MNLQGVYAYIVLLRDNATRNPLILTKHCVAVLGILPHIIASKIFRDVHANARPIVSALLYKRLTPHLLIHVAFFYLRRHCFIGTKLVVKILNNPKLPFIHLQFTKLC